MNNSLIEKVDDTMDSVQTIPITMKTNGQIEKSALVEKLCQDLKESGIHYCHWKSNARVDLSMSGENDLDLLIHRKDKQRFIEILFRLGFKRTTNSSDPKIPGIVNYYGFDLEGQKFIHVHAHFQLVVGHDATKNFRIPIEDAYLASSKFDGLLRVPAPEYEFIIFVIRMVLKHLTWDAFLRNEGRLSKNEVYEFQYLSKSIDEAKLLHILTTYFKFISPERFMKCVESLKAEKFSLKDFQNGKKISQSLYGLSRISVFSDLFKKNFYRLRMIIAYLLKRPIKRKMFVNGGIMIAIVGGDGAGKSTLINKLYNWLKNEFGVDKVHFGKPPWSLLTVTTRSLMKIFRFFTRQPFLEAPIVYTSDHEKILFPGTSWAIRELCTARDRLHLYRKVRRLTTNGHIVFMDRFPVENIKFMESPQIRRMYNGSPKSGLIQWLINKEESIYRFISPPDLMLVIRVDPEISVQRKKEEDEFSVRARATEIWNYPWDTDKVILLDGSRSSEEVFHQAQEIIWSAL